MKRHINNEELQLLIFKEIDGLCSDEEFTKLNEYLASDPKAMDYYLELIVLCSGIYRSGEMLLSVDSGNKIASQNISEICLALAEDEKKAEAVQIELPQIIESSKTPKNTAKRSLFSFFTAVSVAACFLILITILSINRPQIYAPVATLTSNSNAIWQSSRICSEGSRVYTGTVMHLVDGYSEITFDNSAKIVIQSPSTIIIEDNNQVFLQSGKISAVVPPPAKGFLVRTNGASIVDYGTEFGVIADLAGNTETHVFVGNVELRSGIDPIRFESSLRLEGGQAANVKDGVMSGKTQASPMSFVRSIPQTGKFGIPGKRLDLSDILAGGNGLGTGAECVAIDPATGIISSEITMRDRRLKASNYSMVPGNICIDGVFVPIDQEIQQISSEGGIFNGFPQSDNRYWTDISNRPITGMSGEIIDQGYEDMLATLNNVRYGSELHPAVLMHPNTGITFDLDAVRSMNPGVNIKSFTSICGLSETLAKTAVWEWADAVLWVLIDGKEKIRVEISSTSDESKCVNIEVPISGSDRFLTLVATDGQNGNNGDWTFFGDPALDLEPLSQSQRD